MDESEYSYEVRVEDKIRSHVSKAAKELAKPVEKRKTTYSIRWVVGSKPHSKSFKTATLAQRRHNQLTEATSRGEAFHILSGLPMSEYRKIADREAAEKAAAEAAAEAAEKATSCLARFIAFFDSKWDGLADTARRNLGDGLATVTAALVDAEDGRPDRKVLNYVLVNHVFNKHFRDEPLPSTEHEAALKWIREHSLPATALAQDATVRTALNAIDRQPSTGEQAALSSYKRKRATLHQALEYLIEQNVLSYPNPLDKSKWKPHGEAVADDDVIDAAVVANPRQVEALIEACAGYGAHQKQYRSGLRLQAFFALLYYCLMRPGEALDLTEDCFTLPPEPATGQEETHWGVLRFGTSNPQAGKKWTADGKKAKSKSLKQRRPKQYRTVPIPPRGVYWVRRHIKLFDIPSGGRMFVARNGGMIGKTAYADAWRWTRQRALTPQQVASPLAGRPYDLRHGGVSLLLNSGVGPNVIAVWAGHGVDVLLRIYAKCVDGQEDLARRLILKAFAEYGIGSYDENEDAAVTRRMEPVSWTVQEPTLTTS